jgi:hypothetical protein
MITPLQLGILETVHNDLRGILRFLDTPEMADVAGISELCTGLMKSKSVVGDILLRDGLKSHRTETNKEVIAGILEDLARERRGIDTR